MAKLLEDYIDRLTLAEELGVNWRTIHRYENQPDGLPSLLIGGRRMYRLESVRAWLKSRERQRNPTRGRREA
jgi:DNA-binding transcriptional MerR regulator